MKKKKILIALAIFVILVVPFSVFATTSDTPAAKNIRGFFGIDTSKLTDKQKADVKDYTQKMADLQKDFINKMVANGAMTKEQGDAEIKRVDDALKNGGENGFIPGLGMGKGGFGRRGGFGIDGIDTSKLTDKQKTDLMNSYKSMADLQKELVNKMAANGLMTKEQGDAAAKKIDDMINDLQKNGFSKDLRMFMGGFGGFNCFSLNEVDTSKLTDQQKSDFTDFSNKMTGLQKDLINKMVANGAMTKEQGDSAIKKIDDMSKYQKENGFSNGFGMRKGRFGSHGNQGSNNVNSNTAPAT